MASFEARYEQTCPAGDDIDPGDTVRYDSDDMLWHTACLTSEAEAEKKRAEVPADICPICFLVKPCEHSERGPVRR